MSALSHLTAADTQKYPSVLEEKVVQSFSLPDGTRYEIHASRPDEPLVPRFDGGDPEAPIVVIKLKTSRENDWIDTLSSMTVKQPLAPFPNSASEPADHTFATRSRRFGVARLDTTRRLTDEQKWVWIGSLFTLWPSQEYFSLDTESFSHEKVIALIQSGLAILHPSTNAMGHILVSRSAYWQGLGSPSKLAPWVLATSSSSVIVSLLSSNSTLPAPPSKPSGTIYSRYIPGLNSHLTFRVASSQNDADVDIITRWHASDRVNEGWRQKLERDEQIKTIQATEKDPFAIGLIGEWDGEPWGYVEVYYAKESNLAGYYDAGMRDRGFHALVGEEKFRGPHRVRSWMGSVVHLMFLLDPKTERCVSEPRLSNTRMVEYECMCGGHVEKFIDFPHKRAALVWFPRERFFQLCPFQPLPEHVNKE